MSDDRYHGHADDGDGERPGAPLARPPVLQSAVAYHAELIDATAPGDDADALMRLWRDNLPVRGEVDAKRRWAYVDAPTGPAAAMIVRADGGAAVGCAGIERRQLWCGVQAVEAALLADFAVDRGHRTGFPAVLLQRAVQRHVEPRFDLSYGFPNAAAVAVHLRTGYHALGKMPRYVRPLRFARYLARRYADRPLGPALARVAAIALDPAALAFAGVAAARAALDYRLTWLDDVDPRFDALWIDAAPTLPLACRRDAATLRWRFLRAPGERSVVAALTARGDDALLAYAIVRDGEGDTAGIAEVVDLLGASPAALDALLALLVPSLTLEGYGAISVRFLGHPPIPALLARHHFARREATRTIIVRPTARCPIRPEVVRTPSCWYLTDLDEDT